jgi:hypothetical protein
MLRSSFVLAAVCTLAAAPIDVTISGNFGRPSSGSSLFDQQNYFITYTIPDPHSPTRFFDAPGGTGQIEAIYDVLGTLAVPDLALTVISPVEVGYENQAPLGLWLNIGVFSPLPVGDFLLLTPFQTVVGAPLWNGLTGARGVPEINVLNAQPGTARFFLEQNTPNQGPIPLAVYEGPATISAVSIPEPTGLALMLVGLAVFALHRCARVPRLGREKALSHSSSFLS